MTPGFCTACRRPATSTEVGWFHNGQACGGGEFVAACLCSGMAPCWICQDQWDREHASDAAHGDLTALGGQGGVTGPLDDDQALRDGLRGWGA